MNSAPSPTLSLIYGLLSTACWTGAYVLMVKRGFQDKSYGMPVTALCANIAWELLYSVYFPVPSVTRIGNIVWLGIDLLILYTCLRYGRDDFSHPWVRRYLKVLMAGIFVIAGVLEWAFITGYRDTFGKASGTLLDLILSSLLIAMLLRRNSIRGQSFIIALLILVGNAFGYLLALQPYVETGVAAPPQTAPILIHTWFACILALNLIYALLVFQRTQAEQINPLRRW